MGINKSNAIEDVIEALQYFYQKQAIKSLLNILFSMSLMIL
ncbi:MAG: hypothetical protein R2836_09170 [Chitinophagales bacterium]